MSEPSKTIPPPAPAWSPDQKLRADATSVEIRARFDYLDDHMPEEYEQEIWDEPIVAFYIAHEFAAAKLAVGADAEPTPRKTFEQLADEWLEHEIPRDSDVRQGDAPVFARNASRGHLRRFALWLDGERLTNSLPSPFLRGGAPASGEPTP